MRGTRLGLAAPCLLAGSIACTDPPPEDPSVGPPSLWGRSDSTITIDGSHPDEPPSMFVVVRASGLDGPLSFSANELELFGPDGGEPLVTIQGALEPKTPPYANGYAGPTYFTATDLNRDLMAACAATSFKLNVWTSDCRCEELVEGPIYVSCLPDARAEDVLADPGFDAPEGKPCAMTRVRTLGDDRMEEHRYRYDADGRLRFIDIYDQGTVFTERVAFVWRPSGFLGERQTINPETGLLTSRKTYAYGQDGLLSTSETDGYRLGIITGQPDLTRSYVLSQTPWRDDTLVVYSGELSQRTYLYDPVANTIATKDATYVLGGPLDTPNQFFALPEEVDTLKFLQVGVAEYTYDPDGKLLYSEATVLEERDDYAYECP